MSTSFQTFFWTDTSAPPAREPQTPLENQWKSIAHLVWHPFPTRFCSSLTATSLGEPGRNSGGAQSGDMHLREINLVPHPAQPRRCNPLWVGFCFADLPACEAHKRPPEPPAPHRSRDAHAGPSTPTTRAARRCLPLLPQSTAKEQTHATRSRATTRQIGRVARKQGSEAPTNPGGNMTLRPVAAPASRSRRATRAARNTNRRQILRRNFSTICSTSATVTSSG